MVQRLTFDSEVFFSSKRTRELRITYTLKPWTSQDEFDRVVVFFWIWGLYGSDYEEYGLWVVTKSISEKARRFGGENSLHLQVKE
jgi:hypothetical protein